MLKKMNLFDKKHNLSLFFLVFCLVHVPMRNCLSKMRQSVG